MRYLFSLEFPHEPFNKYVREGTAGQLLGRIVEDTKPESIYFTEHDGHRGAVAVYNMDNDSQVAKICEPWFLSLNADCRMRIAMSVEDLGKAGLDTVGKKWP